MFCREWLAQLGQHKNELEASGLQIIAVGLGEPKHARRYCGKLAPGITCLTDKTTGSHQKYGLRQGTSGEMISLDLMKASVRALSSGHIQGQATGDPKMLPGTFIVDCEGRVGYAHYSKHAGDTPPIADLARIGQQLAQK